MRSCDFFLHCDYTAKSGAETRREARESAAFIGHVVH
jgi:hypothetical protein